MLVLIEGQSENIEVKICNNRKLRINLDHIGMQYVVKYYVFLSLGDQFKAEDLFKKITHFLNQPVHEIILLLPYLLAPSENFRIDSNVRSFIISKKVFDSKIFSLINPARFIYEMVNFYLNSPQSNNIEIVQVGKPEPLSEVNENGISTEINESSVQITHKGPLKLLKRCLTHLDKTKMLPQKVEICFDDNSYKRLDLKQFKNIIDNTTLYKNSPLAVGPFLARQYMVEQSANEYIYLLDSDDISVPSRFSKLMLELKERNLDLLGSHELRIDQIGKKLVIARFPLNVNYALAKRSFHPMLHGTCIMTKAGFLKTGGYSTEGKFGYDTQFLLRAGFFLKIGNVDDFLYLRFQRPNSLTTAKKTMYGTKRRKFMGWRWQVDFNLVCSGKLNLSDSSLRERKHDFNFKIDEITK
ncbi:glycosyltransferase [Pedobacter heparinus]|nr:glycosyltransferase [Pedobacter heparinus]